VDRYRPLAGRASLLAVRRCLFRGEMDLAVGAENVERRHCLTCAGPRDVSLKAETEPHSQSGVPQIFALPTIPVNEVVETKYLPGRVDYGPGAVVKESGSSCCIPTSDLYPHFRWFVLAEPMHRSLSNDLFPPSSWYPQTTVSRDSSLRVGEDRVSSSELLTRRGPRISVQGTRSPVPTQRGPDGPLFIHFEQESS
jgi:hypothetical protein